MRAEGVVALACELLDRGPIEGSDIESLASANLARSRAKDKLVLIQVEPQYEYHKAERGRPRLLSFDQAVWRMAGQVQFAQGIAAIYSGLHLYGEAVLGSPLPLRERDRVRGKVVATNLLIQTKSAVYGERHDVVAAAIHQGPGAAVLTDAQAGGVKRYYRLNWNLMR